jgi:hypothetical protein
MRPTRRNLMAGAMAAGAILTGGLGGTANAQVVSPGPGTPLRRAILDALRPLVAADLGNPIEFVVSSIRVSGDRAFVVVNAQRPGGAEIDIARTPLARRVPLSLIDGPRAEALLVRRAGRWRVEHHGIGSTDIWYADRALCPAYGRVLPDGMCRR